MISKGQFNHDIQNIILHVQQSNSLITHSIVFHLFEITRLSIKLRGRHVDLLPGSPGRTLFYNIVKKKGVTKQECEIGTVGWSYYLSSC